MNTTRWLILALIALLFGILWLQLPSHLQNAEKVKIEDSVRVNQSSFRQLSEETP